MCIMAFAGVEDYQTDIELPNHRIDLEELSVKNHLSGLVLITLYKCSDLCDMPTFIGIVFPLVSLVRTI